MIKMSERSRFHFISVFLSFLFLRNTRMYFHFMFIGMLVMFRLRKVTDQKIQKKKKRKRKKNKEKRRKRTRRKRIHQKNRRKK